MHKLVKVKKESADEAHSMYQPQNEAETNYSDHIPDSNNNDIYMEDQDAENPDGCTGLLAASSIIISESHDQQQYAYLENGASSKTQGFVANTSNAGVLGV